MVGIIPMRGTPDDDGFVTVYASPPVAPRRAFPARHTAAGGRTLTPTTHGAAACTPHAKEPRQMTTHVHPGLGDFLVEIHGLGLDAIRDELREVVQRGGGDWLGPAEGEARHPTHMVEIQCFGVWASGGEEIDAVNNWLTIARREIAGRAA